MQLHDYFQLDIHVYCCNKYLRVIRTFNDSIHRIYHTFVCSHQHHHAYQQIANYESNKQKHKNTYRWRKR